MSVRNVAAPLAGLGVALAVAGLVAPHVLLTGARLPLALGDVTWTIEDADGTRDGRPAPVTRQLHMEINDPADDDTASVRVGDTLRAGEAGSDFDNLVTASTWSYVMDRVSGAAVGDAELAAVMAMPATQVRLDGAWLKLPAPAGEQTVDVFDPVLRGAAPAEYAGEEEIAGRTVVRYTQHIAPTNVAQRYADPRNTLTVDGARTFLFHAADRELLVDRETGLVVGIDERVDDYYGDAAGRGVRNVVTYDGKADREDVETLVSRIGDAQPRLASRALWRGVAWTGALLALVGLVIALISLVRSARRV